MSQASQSIKRKNQSLGWQGAGWLRLKRRRAAASRVRRILSVTPYRQQAEVKMIDGLNNSASGNSLSCTSTGAITPINLVQVGSSFNNRVGRRIEMKSLHIHGHLLQTTNNIGVDDYVRIMVIYDRQPNGASPSMSDVLQNFDQSDNGVTSAYSDINPNNRDRFVVLMDQRCVLPCYTAASGFTSSVDGTIPTFSVNRFIKLRGLQTQYKADSSPAAIGDISTGSLFILTLGTQAGGNNGYAAQLSWRLRYTDT